MSTDNKKYICIHGHFYQPPRENPWLNKVEIQDSAYPFHDWNHRINAECYVRNASSRIMNHDRQIESIMNNYGWMSFNIGPTLLAWMEQEAPATYRGILEADKESVKRFSGHGAALAQAFNHLIMPLANEADQDTQVIWGIEDFKSRYGREPEGMWVGETAVNTSTLEAMARHGIKFTILSPYQAKEVRKIGEEKWEDASGAKVDTKRAYVCNLPSGNKINLFFYDGPASQAVAFEGLLNDGERFADKLQGQFNGDDEVQLVHIATDGESYGHHHTLGEMALSYCLNNIDEREDTNLTIYAEFLEKFPPEYEARIIENTSWSCYHGVERWRSNCGCNTGGNEDWDQKWRKPLRDAFDWVRDNLIGLFEAEMKKYSVDAWEIRNRYIHVILNRDEKFVREFLKENFGESLTHDNHVHILKLLEMQYHAMLMYTSCGWFFDEVTGIESMQDIFYAKRAIQLAEEITGDHYEEEFIRMLEKIPSNLPEYGNVLKAYEKYVKPMALDMVRIGAHYAVSSLFEEFPEEVTLYNFTATVKTRYYYEAGKRKIIIGRTIFKSDITWETVDISYAVLHMGDHHLFGGVREYMGAEAFEDMHEDVSRFFKKGNIYEIFNQLDACFGNHNYSFWHLFRDEQRSIMKMVMDNTLKTIDSSMQQIYENSYPLLQTFKEINMTVPNRLKLPVDMALNNRLINELEGEDFDLKRLRTLLETANEMDVTLDEVTLNYLTDQKLNSLMRKLRDQPDDIELIHGINKLITLGRESALSINEWEAQNIAFEIKNEHFDNFADKSDSGDEEAEAWLISFTTLAQHLNLVV
jgi:alpha-amylase/alpha-mannosidase (GH57 family)